MPGIREGWIYGEATPQGSNGRLPPLRLAQGVTTVQTRGYIACFYSPKLSWEEAGRMLEEYVRAQNRGLDGELVAVQMTGASHMKSGLPEDRHIVFITPSGCTLGPPRERKS